MKFMIAGLGSIGRRHLGNLKALGEEDILLYRSGQSTLQDDELERYITETSRCGHPGGRSGLSSLARETHLAQHGARG